MYNYLHPDHINLEEDNAFDSLCQKALQCTNKEDFETAINYYKEALEIKPKQIQVMGELCWCFGQVNQYEEMLNLAKKALLIAQKRLSKDNIGRFYFYIAQYYKITDQFKEANKYFSLAIANKPYFVSNYIDSAYCFKMQGEYLKAIKLYEQVKKIDPDYSEKINIQKLIDDAEEKRKQNPVSSHLQQGAAYEKQGEYKLANVEYYKAYELAPKTDFLPLFLLFFNEVKLKENYYKIISIGESLYKILNQRENENEFSTFLENVCLGLHNCYKVVNDDKNAEKYSKITQSFTHINNAKKAIESKEYEKALEEYQKAYEIRKDGYEIIDGLIDVSFTLRQLDEAVDYAVIGLKLAKANKDDESAAKYYYDIGCRYEISKYNKAEEFYKNALNTASELRSKLKYCRKLALYFSENGNIPKGLEFLKKCLELINEGASDTYDIQSDIVRLEEILNKDSDLNKSTEHYNIGGKLFNEMKYEEAAKEIQIALYYIPQDVDALDILNRCLFKLKRYDECIEVAHEGYLICCRDRDFRFFDMFCYNLGNCFYNMKDNEQALKYYSMALDAKPYDVDYAYFVAACYRNLGNYEKALEYFQLAYKINPEDENISEQIALCKSNLQ